MLNYKKRQLVKIARVQFRYTPGTSQNDQASCIE